MVTTSFAKDDYTVLKLEFFAKIGDVILITCNKDRLHVL